MDEKQELGPNQRKWVEALRGGEYRQGRRALRLKDDSYCCLGVACSLFARGEWSQYAEDAQLWQIEGVYNTASPATVDALALRSSGGMGRNGSLDLWQLNDNQKWSFERIADAIESDPANWFTEVR